MTSLTKSRQFPVCFCVMSLNPGFYLLPGVARPCQSPESDRGQLWTLESQAERVPVLWVYRRLRRRNPSIPQERRSHQNTGSGARLDKEEASEGPC